MRTINMTFDDKTFKKLKEAKEGWAVKWEDFLLILFEERGEE
tara:strand:- start:225 stop:350 length:126 start_codon:yes stop_codon:yes gene_type:complete